MFFAVFGFSSPKLDDVQIRSLYQYLVIARVCKTYVKLCNTCLYLSDNWTKVAEDWFFTTICFGQIDNLTLSHCFYQDNSPKIDLWSRKMILFRGCQQDISVRRSKHLNLYEDFLLFWLLSFLRHEFISSLHPRLVHRRRLLLGSSEK